MNRRTERKLISLQNDDVIAWPLVGFGFHDDVLIGWDRDVDVRVKRLIDSINKTYPNQLLFISEHEGHVVLVWRDKAPSEFRQGETISFERDSLVIRFSERAT